LLLIALLFGVPISILSFVKIETNKTKEPAAKQTSTRGRKRGQQTTTKTSNQQLCSSPHNKTK